MISDPATAVNSVLPLPVVTVKAPAPAAVSISNAPVSALNDPSTPPALISLEASSISISASPLRVNVSEVNAAASIVKSVAVPEEADSLAITVVAPEPITNSTPPLLVNSPVVTVRSPDSVL